MIGSSFNGMTRRLFVNNGLADERAQVGVPTTTVPIRLGASNSSGTAGNFFAGSIKKLVVIPDYIDFATYLKIRAALLL